MSLCVSLYISKSISFSLSLSLSLFFSFSSSRLLFFNVSSVSSYLCWLWLVSLSISPSVLSLSLASSLLAICVSLLGTNCCLCLCFLWLSFAHVCVVSVWMCVLVCETMLSNFWLFVRVEVLSVHSWSTKSVFVKVPFLYIFDASVLDRFCAICSNIGRTSVWGFWTLCISKANSWSTCTVSSLSTQVVAFSGIWVGLELTFNGGPRSLLCLLSKKSFCREGGNRDLVMGF